MKEDYYDILGVKKTATQEEIKQQYKKLALKNHPDRNPNDKKNAEVKMMKINKAYQILSDPQQKQQYDTFGTTNGNQSNPNDFGGFDFSGFGGGHGGMNFDDIFKDIFGGFSQGNSSRKGSDIEEHVVLTFDESYTGKTTTINVKKNISCTSCNGSGSKNGKTQTCSHCHGHGVTRTNLMGMYVSQTCGHCHGEGTIIRDPCDRCHGSGIEKKYTEVKIDIPAGVEHNMKLRFPGLGNSGKPVHGDLIIHCSVGSSKLFTRKGNDLHMQLEIGLKSIILGDKIAVTLPGNKKVNIDIPSGFSPNKDIRISGLGFQQINSRNVGVLIVSLNLKLPKKLNQQQQEAFDKFITSLEEKNTSWW